MRKSGKTALRGFTLVELIVVVAVFGLLLAVALSLLGPVSKLYTTSMEYNDAISMSDNLSMYIEDNLRYSNRIDICDKAYIPAADETAFINKKVSEFAEKYYFDKEWKASQIVDDEKIYVMKINNPDNDYSVTPPATVDLDGDTLPLSAIGSGQVTVWVYDAYTKILSTKKEWAVNRRFYDDYTYTVNMGSFDKSDSKYKVSALNFAMNIKIFKNNKKLGTYHTIANTKYNNVVSFSLENVATTKGVIEEEIYMYKNGKKKYEDDGRKKEDIQKLRDEPRYVYRNSYLNDPTKSDYYVKSGNDIYITYTVCPRLDTYVS